MVQYKYRNKIKKRKLKNNGFLFPTNQFITVCWKMQE